MRDNNRMPDEQPYVLGERARTYTIHRPTVAPPWLPKREDGYDYGAELKVGMFAWLEPMGDETRRRGTADTKRAIAELLSCETDFRRWLAARDAMYEVEFGKIHPVLRDGSGFGSRARTEALRLLWLQHKNLRQRFDKRLLGWANKFGSLGIEDKHGHENVDDMMRCALFVREWLGVGSSETSPWGMKPAEGQVSVTFPPLADAGTEINRRAGQCKRASRTEPWEALTLWSAMCFDLRRHDGLGWKFGVCEATDCHNVFLHTTAPKTYCSPRCGKRMRDRKAKRQR